MCEECESKKVEYEKNFKLYSQVIKEHNQCNYDLCWLCGQDVIRERVAQEIEEACLSNKHRNANDGVASVSSDGLTIAMKPPTQILCFLCSQAAGIARGLK